MAETNAELYDYRLRQITAGVKQLSDEPDAEEIDGENVRIFHYLSAVTAMATATLYERYRGVEATGKVQRMTRVHQYGFKDRPNRNSRDVQYEARLLLGFTRDDEQMIKDFIIRRLGK